MTFSFQTEGHVIQYLEQKKVYFKLIKVKSIKLMKSVSRISVTG